MTDEQAGSGDGPENNEEGKGIVSGEEPSTEELQKRFEERHAETEHGSSESNPATGAITEEVDDQRPSHDA